MKASREPEWEISRLISRSGERLGQMSAFFLMPQIERHGDAEADTKGPSHMDVPRLREEADVRNVLDQKGARLDLRLKKGDEDEGKIEQIGSSDNIISLPPDWTAIGHGFQAYPPEHKYKNRQAVQCGDAKGDPEIAHGE